MSQLKVKQAHLSRRAVVYLRQSTMKQVHCHQESTARQYQMSRRALELGWAADRVDVIDEDLGLSGASVERRLGFQRLAEDVSHGCVGVIFALEVSRLARSSADWHHLLDLCAWADVLIGDDQGLYSPNDPNDRLLLGLKGQMSEAERYWMRLRLQGARLNKARRGELRICAPTGYAWDPTDRRLRLDPDREVQHAVRLIFDRFRIDGTSGRVQAYFLEHGLMLPTGRSGSEVVAKPPYPKTILGILRNPAYAGAYVYGRRESRTTFVDGKLRRGRCVGLPMKQWKVHLSDHHAAYITWEEYLSNQDKLERNRNRPQAPGAARHGQALLQGLVLCGRCGYRMDVQQGGKNRPRYVCRTALQSGGATKVCWSVSSHAIDEAVAGLFLEAGQPPEVELSLAVTHEVERQASELEQQWRLRLDRSGYEARLAERRYKAVDPDNRVVARSLENDWEDKLRALESLQEAYDRARRAHKVELSAADRREILSLASDLPRVWNAKTTTHLQKKQLLRLLVEQVALTPEDVPRRQTRVDVQWHTGATTATLVERVRYTTRQTAVDTVTVIRELASQDRGDEEIAGELNRLALLSATGRRWTAAIVRQVRRRREIRRPNSVRPGEQIAAQRDDGLLSVRGVAARLGIRERRVRDLVAADELQPVEGGGRSRRPMWFEFAPATERRLRALVNKSECADPRP